MDNVNIKLHYYQKALIKKLTLNPKLRFNRLIIAGLESEHMNYHLKKLIDLGLVIKQQTRYLLSDEGKDYSNLMDDQIDVIEKQPKTSIVIHGVRKNLQGEVEHLLNKRLRHPYFGKVGHLTGKVRFGETLHAAAERELYEETGLKANNYDLETVYRKMRKRIDGTWVQDVIFYTFFVRDFSGTLINRTPFQENFWITPKEFEKRKDLDPYDNLSGLDVRLKPKKLTIIEDLDIAKGF